MIPADRDWYRAAAVSEAVLDELVRSAPAVLPGSYLDLLRFSNGGEGPLPVPPLNFRLYPAEEVLQILAAGSIVTDFPGLFVIGGNGGGEAVALDLRAGGPWPVVYFDMTNIHLDESVLPIAPDFDRFVALIGLEEPA